MLKNTKARSVLNVDERYAVRDRNRLGIVTGSGPEAGIDLWTKVLDHTRKLLGPQFRGDLDAPEVFVHSVPALGLSMELERFDTEVWRSIETAVRQMAQTTEVIAIACNTLNVYAQRLQALDLPARILSMPDVATDFIEREGLQRVALLGSRPVMEMGRWSAYSGLPRRVHVEVPVDLEGLHKVIYDVKRKGGQDPDVVDTFRHIISSLHSTTALLACTELPLIRLELPTTVRLVDVTDLLAQTLAVEGQRPHSAPVKRTEIVQRY